MAKIIKCHVCNQEFDTDTYNIGDFEFYATKICEKCFKAWKEGVNKVNE